MNHPLTHRMEQILTALRWRRIGIEIGPTGNTAHVVLFVSLGVVEAESFAHGVDGFGLGFVIGADEHFGE